MGSTSDGMKGASCTIVVTGLLDSKEIIPAICPRRRALEAALVPQALEAAQEDQAYRVSPEGQGMAGGLIRPWNHFFHNGPYAIVYRLLTRLDHWIEVVIAEGRTS